MVVLGLWTVDRNVEAADAATKIREGTVLVVWGIVVALPAWLFELWRWRRRGTA
jgi:hypothetical protein